MNVESFIIQNSLFLVDYSFILHPLSNRPRKPSKHRTGNRLHFGVIAHDDGEGLEGFDFFKSHFHNSKNGNSHEGARYSPDSRESSDADDGGKRIDLHLRSYDLGHENIAVKHMNDDERYNHPENCSRRIRGKRYQCA